LIGKFNVIFGSILLYNIGGAGLVLIAHFTKKEKLKYNDIYCIISLAFIALGAAGIKSNISTFAARQVSPFGEAKVRSLFNYFYWLINLSAILSCTVIAYLQLYDFFYGYLSVVCGVFLSTFVFICSRKFFIYKYVNGSHLTDITKILFHALQRKVKFRKEIQEELPQYTSLDLLEYAHLMFGGSYSTDQIDIVRCFGRMTLIFLTLVMYWTVYFQVCRICCLIDL